MTRYSFGSENVQKRGRDHLFLQALQHIVCLCIWNTISFAHQAEKVEQRTEYLRTCVCVCSGLRVCLLEAILQARQRERGFERLKCQPEQTTNHNLHEGHAQPKRVYSPLNKFVSGSFLDANTRTSCWCVGRRCLLFLSLP